MDLTINVKIGVTPELEKIAMAFLNKEQKKAIAAEAVEVKDEPKEAPKSPAKEKKPTKTVNDKAEEQKEAEKPKEEPTEQPKEEQPKAESTSAVPSYTEEDIRTAMHQCRVRFEGDDYKVNTTSDGYTKHHKNLTAWFKIISARLGSDKPSALPAELRAAFISDCANTIIDDSGAFTISTPF